MWVWAPSRRPPNGASRSTKAPCTSTNGGSPSGRAWPSSPSSWPSTSWATACATFSTFVWDGEMVTAPLLEVRGLKVRFPTAEGDLEAVRGIDLDLPAGATLGLVGESGSGKSVSMLAVMGLLPREAEVEGSIRLQGE